jgi:hypothetical protein
MKAVVMRGHHGKTFSIKESAELPGWFYIVTNDGDVVHMWEDTVTLFSKEKAETILTLYEKTSPLKKKRPGE